MEIADFVPDYSWEVEELSIEPLPELDLELDLPTLDLTLEGDGEYPIADFVPDYSWETEGELVLEPITLDLEPEVLEIPEFSFEPLDVEVILPDEAQFMEPDFEPEILDFVPDYSWETTELSMEPIALNVTEPEDADFAFEPLEIVSEYELFVPELEEMIILPDGVDMDAHEMEAMYGLDYYEPDMELSWDDSLPAEFDMAVPAFDESLMGFADFVPDYSWEDDIELSIEPLDLDLEIDTKEPEFEIETKPFELEGEYAIADYVPDFLMEDDIELSIEPLDLDLEIETKPLELEGEYAIADYVPDFLMEDDIEL